jgi:hypothetical protein
MSERSLVGLAAFARDMRSPWIPFGEWDSIGFLRSEFADRFVRQCCDDGWVLPDFDWPAWANSPEAQALRDPAVILAEADAGQLAKLLTVAIRQDRFIEGGLEGWHRRGLLAAICNRASGLAMIS